MEWSHFTRVPTIYSYQALMELVPGTERASPEQAARLWRALGLGIVNRGKSKQYTAAVEYFGRAKRCFTAAGLPDYWDQLVDQVRTDHCRKAGFIREFEEVAAGMAPEPGPTFLEKARARYAPPD
ncbi:MAG: hypothetical protein ACYCO9_08770 [Streptosporangiaceae bacterium]